MSPKQQKVLAYDKNSQEALDALLKEDYNFLNKDLMYQLLIYELDHTDIPSNIFFENLSSEDIVNLIKDYYYRYGFPVLDIKTNITSDDLEFNTNSLNKGQYKFDNMTWTIHKNDKDPFPSNPHAHCYSEQIKLHLGSGELYHKKEVVGKMKKKSLKQLQKAVEANLGKNALKHLKARQKK